MSGQRSTSPQQGGDTPTRTQTPTPLSTANTSSDNATLAAILAKLTNLDDTVSGLRRSMQRMDGRLDSTVGGLSSLKERVEEMEGWLPGEDPTTPEEEADHHSHSMVMATDMEQSAPLPTTSQTPLTVASATSANPDSLQVTQSDSQAPQGDSTSPPVKQQAHTQALHGDSTSTPITQQAQPLPYKPPRPPKASTRPPHLDQPHALKPPQVRAFRKLTQDDKDEFRRLAGLVGGSVREYLDGKFDVEALAEEEEDDDRSSRSSKMDVTSVKSAEPTDRLRSERVQHSTTTSLQTPPATPVQVSTLTCKTEHLGSFDGTASELESFISRVRNLRRSDRRPAWEAAVVRVLPRVLKDDAAAWHEGLDDDEADALDSVDAWVEAMRLAFPINAMELRKTAMNREWHPDSETVSAYYHTKLRLLRQAYGRDEKESRLVMDIKDGLPASMRSLIHIPVKGSGATLLTLRSEITEWEPTWREMYGSKSATSLPSSPTKTATSKNMPATKSTVPAMARSASAPVAPVANPASPASTGGFGLAATYDASRVTPAANGKPRSYRRPDGVVMELNRPCNRCGGDHFNFEHFHVATPQVRMLEVHDGDDDYPEVVEEVMGAGDDDSDFE
ncbi:hypothetical protein A4X13_0g7782 [Tilletia indica]|uniref:Retrotransposon gag domain-containing protein n=1 Tax=Tilletia indica TaxID=43049 RepID=A0A177THK6_9BASI|nr:hypothetical protein A4X13_0g7782 [Tilletia indica]